MSVSDDAFFGWLPDALLSPAPDINAEPIDALVTFARNGDPAELNRASLTEEVALGLGPDIYTSATPDELRDRNAWLLDVEFYGGATGPFNVLDRFEQLQEWEISVGPHNHCAGPPRPAPAGFEDHIRVSAQPVLEPGSSCLQWFTVDVFMTEEGFVEAITVDWWEP